MNIYEERIFEDAEEDEDWGEDEEEEEEDDLGEDEEEEEEYEDEDY
jgi:hypothetical protein